jgi:CRISPR-associated endonuclease/helicase Cas3
MSNSIKTIKQLIDENPALEKLLINAHSYYAHVSKHKVPETLSEHISLVQEKFVTLCEVYLLDDVIDKLILDILADAEHTNGILNFVKKLFVNTIVFHDYGKVNENFQAHPEKMDNPHFKGKEKPNSPLSTHHSSLGAYLYIVKHIQEIVSSCFSQTQQGYLIAYVLGFSYVIFKHHASQLQDKGDLVRKFCFSENEIHFLKQYIEQYQFLIDERISTTLFASNPNLKRINVEVQFEKLSKLTEKFSFYMLIRLAFSLLTASDYLASNEYMTDIKLEDFGTLCRQRVEQIYQHITQSDFLDEAKQKINFNKKIYQELNNYGRLKNPKEISRENLNVLRKEMAFEVIRNVRTHSDKNLFYIEAPTGGGKTNLSMLATIELLKANPNLKKVYYVFPFTTLITQTHKAIIETMGLSSDEVVQLHSKAGFQSKEEVQDGMYGNQKLNYLDNLFVNYPFCLLSHIKFFDLLKTHEKENNYLLHRLANSVVVIDELQSYNPSHWDKVIYFIRNFAKFFNIKFILMSATLPKLDKLNVIQNEVQDFVYLLPNAKENYFQNPNFAQRVTFRFDLLNEKEINLESLAKTLLEKSEQYAQKDFGEAKPKGSVYTIIEFIFKKSATEFYKVISQQNTFFDEIFVLSGTILEHRRKYIIDFLKNPDNRKKKILLITTQVVEAGVDIDMDLGFKNQSLIDSDEQLAGRINRNVNKKDCELYLFKVNEPSVLYSKDKRYQATKQIKNEYAEILNNKDFDRLYQIVLKDIDKWNETPMAVGFRDYLNNITTLNFQNTNKKFQLIEQKNISVFVPLDVPADTFSKNELKFLEKANILPNVESKIEGSKVFDLYINLIENKSPDFITQKVSLKTLQGILSKFVFSIFDDSQGNTRRKLIAFADIEKVSTSTHQKTDGTSYGFIYLARYNEVYDELFGLNDSQFEASENCIL